MDRVDGSVTTETFFIRADEKAGENIRRPYSAERSTFTASPRVNDRPEPTSEKRNVKIFRQLEAVGSAYVLPNSISNNNDFFFTMRTVTVQTSSSI